MPFATMLGRNKPQQFAALLKSKSATDTQEIAPAPEPVKKHQSYCALLGGVKGISPPKVVLKASGNFDELHPRYPVGSPKGGQFMPKGSHDYNVAIEKHKEAVEKAKTAAKALAEVVKHKGSEWDAKKKEIADTIKYHSKDADVGDENHNDIMAQHLTDAGLSPWDKRKHDLPLTGKEKTFIDKAYAAAEKAYNKKMAAKKLDEHKELLAQAEGVAASQGVDSKAYKVLMSKANKAAAKAMEYGEKPETVAEAPKQVDADIEAKKQALYDATLQSAHNAHHGIVDDDLDSKQEAAHKDIKNSLGIDASTEIQQKAIADHAAKVAQGIKNLAEAKALHAEHQSKKTLPKTSEGYKQYKEAAAAYQYHYKEGADEHGLNAEDKAEGVKQGYALANAKKHGVQALAASHEETQTQEKPVITPEQAAKNYAQAFDDYYKTLSTHGTMHGLTTQAQAHLINTKNDALAAGVHPEDIDSIRLNAKSKWFSKDGKVKSVEEANAPQTPKDSPYADIKTLDQAKDAIYINAHSGYSDKEFSPEKAEKYKELVKWVGDNFPITPGQILKLNLAASKDAEKGTINWPSNSGKAQEQPQEQPKEQPQAQFTSDELSDSEKPDPLPLAAQPGSLAHLDTPSKIKNAIYEASHKIQTMGKTSYNLSSTDPEWKEAISHLEALSAHAQKHGLNMKDIHSMQTAGVTDADNGTFKHPFKAKSKNKSNIPLAAQPSPAQEETATNVPLAAQSAKAKAKAVNDLINSSIPEGTEDDPHGVKQLDTKMKVKNALYAIGHKYLDAKANGIPTHDISAKGSAIAKHTSAMLGGKVSLDIQKKAQADFDKGIYQPPHAKIALPLPSKTLDNDQIKALAESTNAYRNSIQAVEYLKDKGIGIPTSLLKDATDSQSALIKASDIDTVKSVDKEAVNLVKEGSLTVGAQTLALHHIAQIIEQYHLHGSEITANLADAYDDLSYKLGASFSNKVATNAVAAYNKENNKTYPGYTGQPSKSPGLGSSNATVQEVNDAYDAHMKASEASSKSNPYEAHPLNNHPEFASPSDDKEIARLKKAVFDTSYKLTHEVKHNSGDSNKINAIASELGDASAKLDAKGLPKIDGKNVSHHISLAGIEQYKTDNPDMQHEPVSGEAAPKTDSVIMPTTKQEAEDLNHTLAKNYYLLRKLNGGDNNHPDVAAAYQQWNALKDHMKQNLGYDSSYFSQTSGTYKNEVEKDYNAAEAKKLQAKTSAQIGYQHVADAYHDLALAKGSSDPEVIAAKAGVLAAQESIKDILTPQEIAHIDETSRKGAAARLKVKKDDAAKEIASASHKYFIDLYTHGEDHDKTITSYNNAKNILEKHTSSLLTKKEADKAWDSSETAAKKTADQLKSLGNLGATAASFDTKTWHVFEEYQDHAKHGAVHDPKADEAWSKFQYKQIDDLKSQEKSKLQAYTGSAYREINREVGKAGALSMKGESAPLSESTKKYMKAFDNVFSKMTLGQDMMLNRAMRSDWMEQQLGFDHTSVDPESLVGKVYKENAYSSAGTNLDKFTKCSSGSGIRLYIRAPSETNAIWVKPFSNHSSENEVVIGRGATYVIRKAERKGGTLYLHVDLVGQFPEKLQ